MNKEMNTSIQTEKILQVYMLEMSFRMLFSNYIHGMQSFDFCLGTFITQDEKKNCKH